jgi:hypothetical protein
MRHALIAVEKTRRFTRNEVSWGCPLMTGGAVQEMM